MQGCRTASSHCNQYEFYIEGLVDWRLTPTLAVFQLYGGVNKFISFIINNVRGTKYNRNLLSSPEIVRRRMKFLAPKLLC